MSGAAGLAAWLDYQHTTATFEGEPVSVARIDQLGVPGYCVFLARASGGTVRCGRGLRWREGRRT